MKALTIIQPWADAIVSGEKKIETRSWSTNYRGPLLIHSGKGKMDGAPDNVPGSRKLGYVLAEANLVDCVKMDEDFISKVNPREKELGFYEVGRYAWILEDVTPVEPYKRKGRQRLWNCIPETMKYKSPWRDEPYTVRIKTDTYQNGRLYVGLDFFEDGYWGPYGDITVNLPDCTLHDDYEAFVDVNNIPYINYWLEEYGIAEPTYNFGFSGFCAYPTYKFKKELFDKH